MQHRHVSNSPLPMAEPLLGPSIPQGRRDIALTPKQLQQIGGALIVLLLMFLGVTYYNSASRLQRNSLSRCSDRLAASGLELSAAASLALPGQFSDDPSASSMWQRAQERQALYGEMATEAQRRGLLLGHEILGDTITQSQVFDRVSKPGHWKRPTVKAKLHPLEHPVRSIVLPLHDDAAVTITTALKKVLHNIVSEDSIWWQEEHLMHAPLLHASIQETPAPSTPEQLASESAAVATVAYSHCPVHAVLDRMVVSHTGVIMACWQVLPGSSEPAVLRQALQASLPQAPPADQQPIQYPAVLYTTVGRLLAPPRRPDAPGHPGMEWDMVFLQSAVLDALEEASDELCGLTTLFKEMWYVKEKDLMALALNGHYSKHSSHLKCHKTAPATVTV